jgi:beta-phosphoglucomutase
VFYFHDTTDIGTAMFSYDVFDEDGLMLDIAEKERISSYANTGAYYFQDAHELCDYCYHVLEQNIRFNNEFYTSCVIKAMLQDALIWRGLELHPSSIKMVGTPKQLQEYMNDTYLFLFDLDGTLVHTDHIYHDVWADILQPYHMVLTREMYDKIIKGNNDHHVVDVLLPCISTDKKAQISKIKDKQFENRISDIQEVPGAVDFIKSLKQQGHKVGIVTNCNRSTAQCILEHLMPNMQQYVDIVVIGNECTRAKPYPDPYEDAMERMQMTRDKVIIFEDSVCGMTSAKQAMPGKIVGVYNTHTDFGKLGISHVIHDYVGLCVDDVLCKRTALYDISAPDLRCCILRSLKKDTDICDVDVGYVKMKGGFIADIIPIDLAMRSQSIPCVIKLRTHDVGPMGQMAKMLHLHERECYFYDAIHRYVNVNVPKCYGLVYDDRFDTLGIVLENLNTTEYELAVDLNQAPLKVSLRVIERMAELHWRFWNKDLGKICPLLKRNDDSCFKPFWTEYVQTNWKDFKAKWSPCLTTQQICLADAVVEKYASVQHMLSVGNLTLCHGDLKSANIFYKKTRDHEPYFIDWQYVVHGKGVQDLAFFMVESFDATVSNKYYDLFTTFYYVKLTELSITYNKHEFERDLMAAICYFPLFVAVWFGTTDKKYLLDVNFPPMFILKYFCFLEQHVTLDFVKSL